MTLYIVEIIFRIVLMKLPLQQHCGEKMPKEVFKTSVFTG
jgi:hypothetical protein